MNDNDKVKQIAIIGPTASGKSTLAVDIAKKMNAIILSLDSLSLYKEIDIVSAKPTMEEQEGVTHLGIDLIYPDQQFDVTLFQSLYREAHSLAVTDNKNLVIVGGTSFYLKVLTDGISTLPTLDEEAGRKVNDAMADKGEAYRMLSDLDPEYMQNIALNDVYRIEKALEIFYASGIKPSQYFKKNLPISSIVGKIDIYNIATEKSTLRSRIKNRTEKMLKQGLIDEVSYLEKKYTRSPNCMKAIGIKETLSYLDGLYSKSILKEKIVTNTARLAKRQVTFNRTQFDNITSLEIRELEKRILKI